MENSSARDIPLKPRGQQQPPLTKRLANILKGYTEGVGIIKELIQNADDANATRVEITLDWRTHKTERLPDQRMKALMGPAILAYNDSVFTDDDFESIYKIEQSVKAEDLHKTGKFGLGFNAVYNVTDYPSLISRNRIIFFDPHCATIPGATTEHPGGEGQLDQWWTRYPDFLKIYEAGKLPFNVKDFKATLFRLPLRTEEQAKISEIRQLAFGEKNIRDILDKLSNAGEELLLFLKSVLEISFYEIAPDSDGKRTELLTIRTNNLLDVKRERQKILNVIPDDTDTLLEKCRNESGALASVSYRHEIQKTLNSQETTTTIWRVVSIIGSDSKGEVAEAIAQMQAQKEKSVPWAGAAARISISTNDGNLKPITGKAYCFLPTPIETGLPIHINGFFALDDERKNLISQSNEDTSTAKVKPRWNQVLVRHVLSVACANLIADLVGDIGESNTEYFYQLWPVNTNNNTNNKVLEELPRAVLQLLFNRKVIRSAVEHLGFEQDNGKKVVRTTKWVTPSKIKVLSSKNLWKSLLEPLTADEIDIPNPYLPDEIVDGFKKADYGLEAWTPAKLREYLKEDKPFVKVILEDAPKPSLQNRDWVIEMLRYCMRDKPKNLTGLPLAILADNTLQVFGYNPIGTIYLADPEEMRIFANKPQWFLDPNLKREVSEIGDCSSVSKMGAREVAQKLVHVIGSTEGGLFWKPDAIQPPNTNWLIHVYRYFTKVSFLPIEDLKRVPLVPGNDGKLYKGGCVDTPLWCGDDINKEEIEALKYFGIPLVEAPPLLLNAIAQFIEKHPNKFILPVTGPDLANRLNTLAGKLPSYHPKHHNALLNFLANSLWLKGPRSYSTEQQEILKKLPIYPTACKQLVSLIDKNVYIPGDYKPPAVAGSLTLLLMGPSASEWLPLFKMLKIQDLVRFRLIVDCLLPSYANLNHEEQRTALAWIRDNLEEAKKEEKKEGSNPDRLVTRIKEKDLVRCTDGQLLPVTSVYSLESDARKILEGRIPLPDLKFYSQEQDWIFWQQFFDSLGIRETARADDILAYVDDLIENAEKNGPDAVADYCIKIFEYLVDVKNWEVLKKEKMTNRGINIYQYLKDKPWLPVIRDPNQLKQYPEAKRPEERLYRAEEVCFLDDAHLVASQKLIFGYQRTRIKDEIWTSLGFQKINAKMVVDHFDTLITSLESK